ncbi:hypothetical protein [Nocardioides sp. TF02-7]|uniref:hypothetical protein n=1 Tax=Nocardioides sp. TF02-7 TaxID=2917724 RepID=UPI001F06A3E4|nr:hypothetical protein [Nocardioides sp. TF02-7]UMG91146.1 hypothetical protein MF408_13160 [Nocardioides sp. TF02-7]
MRYDDAVIDLANRAASTLEAVGVLADACGGRRTTTHRLRERVAVAARLHRRDWLLAVLADVEDGTCSVLEHGYLTLVERPHGLPRGIRQALATIDGRRMFRDVLYRGRQPAWLQVVELDGRLFHDSAAARNADLERDLDAAIEHTATVRLGYAQVYDHPCRTAGKIGQLLRLRGWTGNATPCPNCAPEAELGEDRMSYRSRIFPTSRFPAASSATQLPCAGHTGAPPLPAQIHQGMQTSSRLPRWARHGKHRLSDIP